ncbi:hypothetical protein, partial [Streptomyces sp. SID3343]|uniref:coiled-coil domain-containing protein n=1 Tax=Streptomyces sp. SID3343 TaxID=2690260 RepID=UPI0013C16AD6
TRYFKGQRVAPRDFLDKLAAFLADRDTPLMPEEHDRLDRLRSAALAGSTRQGNQVLYWKEEAARLAVTEKALTARWQDERERGVLDRRRATEVLGALELEVAELRERLEHTEAARADAEAQRDTLRDRVREQDRRLHAAADYAREIEGELAEHRATFELLRREVDVLRRQVDVLSEEKPQPRSRAHERVGRATTQVTAEGSAASPPESRADLASGGGVAATEFGYRVSSRPAGEVSDELFAEINLRWEAWARRNRARADPATAPGLHRTLVVSRGLAMCLGPAIAVVGTAALYVGDIDLAAYSFYSFIPWFLLVGWSFGAPRPYDEMEALSALRHPWQVWPCQWSVDRPDGMGTCNRFTLLDPEGRPTVEFTSTQELDHFVPHGSRLELVWVAGTFDSPCVIAFPSPTSWKGKDAVLVAVPEPVTTLQRTIDPDEFASLVDQARNAQVD